MFWFGLACFPENHANCWGAVSMFFFHPSVVVFVGRRSSASNIFRSLLFFNHFKKFAPEGQIFWNGVPCLAPPGGLGGLAPQESPLITRALPPQRPCLAPVPCPQFFFVRNFFVRIFFVRIFFVRCFFVRRRSVVRRPSFEKYFLQCTVWAIYSEVPLGRRPFVVRQIGDDFIVNDDPKLTEMVKNAI